MAQIIPSMQGQNVAQADAKPKKRAISFKGGATLEASPVRFEGVGVVAAFTLIAGIVAGRFGKSAKAVSKAAKKMTQEAGQQANNKQGFWSRLWGNKGTQEATQEATETTAKRTANAADDVDAKMSQAEEAATSKKGATENVDETTSAQMNDAIEEATNTLKPDEIEAIAIKRKSLSAEFKEIKARIDKGDGTEADLARMKEIAEEFADQEKKLRASLPKADASTTNKAASETTEKTTEEVVSKTEEVVEEVVEEATEEPVKWYQVGKRVKNARKQASEAWDNTSIPLLKKSRQQKLDDAMKEAQRLKEEAKEARIEGLENRAEAHRAKRNKIKNEISKAKKAQKVVNQYMEENTKKIAQQVEFTKVAQQSVEPSDEIVKLNNYYKELETESIKNALKAAKENPTPENLKLAESAAKTHLHNMVPSNPQIAKEMMDSSKVEKQMLDNINKVQKTNARNKKMSELKKARSKANNVIAEQNKIKEAEMHMKKALEVLEENTTKENIEAAEKAVKKYEKLVSKVNTEPNAPKALPPSTGETYVGEMDPMTKKSAIDEIKDKTRHEVEHELGQKKVNSQEYAQEVSDFYNRPTTKSKKKPKQSFEARYHESQRQKEMAKKEQVKAYVQQANAAARNTNPKASIDAMSQTSDELAELNKAYAQESSEAAMKAVRENPTAANIKALESTAEQQAKYVDMNTALKGAFVQTNLQKMTAKVHQAADIVNPNATENLVETAVKAEQASPVVTKILSQGADDLVSNAQLTIAKNPKKLEELNATLKKMKEEAADIEEGLYRSEAYSVDRTMIHHELRKKRVEQDALADVLAELKGETPKVSTKDMIAKFEKLNPDDIAKYEKHGELDVDLHKLYTREGDNFSVPDDKLEEFGKLESSLKELDEGFNDIKAVEISAKYRKQILEDLAPAGNSRKK